MMQIWIIRIGIAAAVLCMLIAAVLLYGQNRYRAGVADGKTAVQTQLQAQAAKQAETAHAASAGYQAARAASEQKEKVRYVEVQKIVERPVYRNECFDTDGLQQLNTAIADSD
ncbi:hypothetical protein L1281_002136 [Neisseria sp. HSC-16F19]|nr:hypothetical protein [Neisseria sp. HSC-16F19]MCP2041534.1 hypothetical protein [Neisseria sp. HSC-16F19]